MSNNPFVAQFRAWFAHEDDAHAKTLASIQSVPADRRASPEYVRACGLLAHNVLVRRIWLARMSGGPPYTGAPFPDGTDLAAVDADWRAVKADWEQFFAGLTDDGLARAFEYSGLFGGRFRSRVGDVLPHLFSHHAYHRGQIALLVKQAGGTPAATDFIYSNRETLESA
jgi:uncharacterized damage-inducible protein DinB